jgi:hypothetical protein
VPLAFDLTTINVIEFGVGRETDSGVEFVMIPTDEDIKTALEDMASQTVEALSKHEEVAFAPAEKYDSQENVVTATNGEYAGILADLHRSQMLPILANALSEPENIVCYFARLSGGDGKRLTCVRRATQFKGILKSRLIQVVTDALKIVEERTFKLDNDYDLLIDDENIHILRASGFVVLSGIEGVVMAAVPHNIARLQEHLPFVDFASISTFAATHSRAAKVLATICSEGEANDVSKERLIAACNECGAEVQIVVDQVRPQAGHELSFLYVLDRRLFRVQLVEGRIERYQAGSRRPVQGA